MDEGPIQEASYFFPADRMRRYLETLPAGPAVEPRFLPPTDRKIAVMTHDDEFDPKFDTIERGRGVRSTWFLLASRLDAAVPDGADVHLHFDKEFGRLADQIEAFRSRFGRAPRFNRTHRLLWRGDNFDFPLLGSHGFAADSTRVGTRPFRPVIEGRLLDLWEIPFSVCDVSPSLRATFNLGATFSAPFAAGASPVVVLAHPTSVCEAQGLRSCFSESLDAAARYGYAWISLSEFFDRYCAGV